MKVKAHVISGVSPHICCLCYCSMAHWSFPRLPCLTAHLQGCVSGDRSSWHGPSLAGGLAPIFYSPELRKTHTPSHRHTYTHMPKRTLPHCSFCILSFNQALSRASVTSPSTQCAKDLSPQVTSLTDLLTDRPLAHLAADVTAVPTVATAGSTP